MRKFIRNIIAVPIMCSFVLQMTNVEVKAAQPRFLDEENCSWILPNTTEVRKTETRNFDLAYGGGTLELSVNSPYYDYEEAYGYMATHSVDIYTSCTCDFYVYADVLDDWDMHHYINNSTYQTSYFSAYTRAQSANVYFTDINGYVDVTDEESEYRLSYGFH